MPKIGYDVVEAAMARMDSHALEGSPYMKAYACSTCGKWHLGTPIWIRRNYPIDNKETLILELTERVVACIWDETYRDLWSRAYQIRKKGRSAQRRSDRWERSATPSRSTT